MPSNPARSQRHRWAVHHTWSYGTVQVADALDDFCVGDWIHLAGRYLGKQLDESVNRPPDSHVHVLSGKAVSSDIVESLSQLPDHVQTQVFATAAALPGCSVHHLLQRLPQHLHGKIVTSLISPDKSFKLVYGIGTCCSQQSCIDALTALPAQPPSILSLTIDSVPCKTPSDRSSPSNVVDLGKLLQHHSCLSTLALCRETSSFRYSTVQDVIPDLPSLTALQTLDLTSERSSPENFAFAADSAPFLQRCLRSLPHLEDLAVSIDLEPRLARRHRRTDCPPPRHCLASMLSPATTLTSLHLVVVSAHPDGIFEAGASLPLPHLRSLQMGMQNCQWARLLLQQLQAPLTRLTLDYRSLERLCGSPEAAGLGSVAEAANFAVQLSKYTCMRSMRVQTEGRTWTGAALSAALVAASPAHAALQHLQELSVDLDFHLMEACTPLLRGAVPELRRLSLSSRGGRSATRARWSAVLQHLTALHLQHLALEVRGDSPNTGPCISDIRPLSCLSALSLRDYEVLQGRGDFALLAAMTQLRHLHLDGFTLPRESWDGLVPCLGALSCLERLRVRGAGVAEALAPACARCALHGLWPVLRRLSVPVAPARRGVAAAEWEAEDPMCAVVRAACGLPALQELELILTVDEGDDWSMDEDAMEAVLEDFFTVPVSLRSIVRAAGAAFSIRSSL